MRNSDCVLRWGNEWRKLLLGFSLFELLIVLAIISILSAIAFPVFTHHMVREKRIEAEITLTKLATALEHYYTLHNTYQNATLNTLGFTPIIANGYYELTLSSTTNDFVLEATPLKNQTTDCPILTLNAAGKKECW